MSIKPKQILWVLLINTLVGNFLTRRLLGDPPYDPLSYVSSMNITYVLALGFALVALSTSVMRGSGKIQAAQARPH